MSDTIQYQKYFIDVVFSPHDGGHYAEVFDKEGVTVYTTSLLQSHSVALRNAKRYIKKFLK